MIPVNAFENRMISFHGCFSNIDSDLFPAQEQRSRFPFETQERRVWHQFIQDSGAPGDSRVIRVVLPVNPGSLSLPRVPAAHSSLAGGRSLPPILRHGRTRRLRRVPLS